MPTEAATATAAATATTAATTTTAANTTTTMAPVATTTTAATATTTSVPVHGYTCARIDDCPAPNRSVVSYVVGNDCINSNDTFCEYDL